MTGKTKLTLRVLGEAAFDASIGLFLVALTDAVSWCAVTVLSRASGMPTWKSALLWCIPTFMAFMALAHRDRRNQNGRRR